MPRRYAHTALITACANWYTYAMSLYGMTYQLTVNGASILSGDLWAAAAIIIAILVLLSAAAAYFWRTVRETETMKYEFITIIAHKFRTPLTTSKWLLENMAVEETDPHIKENFGDLKDSNEKLIALTGTLIELTNLDNENRASYAWEKVPLCEFAKSVADAHKDMFHEKNIFVSVQCADPRVLVSLDRPRMEFVLQTLLENACTYSPTGRNVEVVVAHEGGSAVVAVTDHGIGVSRGDLPKLFRKFYRTDNAKSVDTEGFGVGLFLAQSIARRHGGKIRAYSAGVDQGSTFTLTLPRAR